MDPLGDGLYELFVQHCGSAPAVGMQALGLGQLFPNLVRALNEDISSAVPSTSGAPPVAAALRLGWLRSRRNPRRGHEPTSALGRARAGVSPVLCDCAELAAGDGEFAAPRRRVRRRFPSRPVPNSAAAAATEALRCGC